MNKILSFLFTLLLLMVSCSQEEQEKMGSDRRQIVDGMLLADFTFQDFSLLNVTRSFSKTPEIRTMKVVVFDENGVYISQSDAVLVDPSAPTAGSGKYQAFLPVSNKDEKRIIHFIVNYEGEISYGTELEVISKLVTTDGNEAYWQRIEVDNLKASEVAGDMVFDHQNQLQGINLIRNFCAFTVSSVAEESNLQITEAIVCNVPDRGTVAPYSSDQSGFVGTTGLFVSNYQTYNTPGDLIDAGYKAAVPIGRVLKNLDETNVDGSGNITLFSYEREMPVENPPYILVAGKYGTTPGERSAALPTWYKINLRDTDENYYPLLRNFDYKVLIKSVSGAGAATKEEALAGTGSGDVSTDIKYSGLTDISNGEARMIVTHTEMMLVTGSPVTIKYKFLPDVSSDTPSNGGNVTITRGVPGSTGAIFTDDSKVLKSGSDDAEGYRTITLTPVAPAASVKTQDIILTGTYSTGGGKTASITRVVKFILREKPSLTLSVLDESKNDADALGSVQGTPFWLRIGIPGGLPSSIFPLTIEIESNMNSISSNELLPVNSKTSRWYNKPAIVFDKIVNWSDYDAIPMQGGMKYVDVHMKTNKASSACSIRIYNEYFNYAEDSFTNN